MIYIFIGVFTIYFFALSWIVIGFFKHSKKRSNIYVQEQKISVILPVRNEEEHIVECLESLINQDYDAENFEIIVVNDHSEDKTLELINQLVSKTNISISVITLKDDFSKKSALKRGVKNSKHPLIASTDGDCILPVTWLRNITINLTEKGSMLIGPVMFFKQTGFLNAFQLLDFSAIQGVTFGSSFYQKPILNNAANLAYLKVDLEKVNGYDNFSTPSGDDVFLLEKFSGHELSISSLLNQKFIVKTAPSKSWKSFFHQRIRWASKSGFYTNKLLLFFSGLILITNIFTLFIYFFMFFIEELRIIAVILLLSKWLIDFILLFLVSSFFKQRGVLKYFIPVQLVYPIYILLIGLASKFYKFEWKGRKVNE